MPLQPRVVLLVGVDDFQEMGRAALAGRRGDQALDVQHVGIQEQMNGRLEIVGIGAADVAGDDHPGTVSCQRAAGRDGLGSGSIGLGDHR